MKLRKRVWKIFRNVFNVFYLKLLNDIPGKYHKIMKYSAFHFFLLWSIHLSTNKKIIILYQFGENDWNRNVVARKRYQ